MSCLPCSGSSGKEAKTLEALSPSPRPAAKSAPGKVRLPSCALSPIRRRLQGASAFSKPRSFLGLVCFAFVLSIGCRCSLLPVVKLIVDSFIALGVSWCRVNTDFFFVVPTESGTLEFQCLLSGRRPQLALLIQVNMGLSAL
jgi:hypothetical protein